MSEAVQLLLPFGTPKELRNEEGAQKDWIISLLKSESNQGGEHKRSSTQRLNSDLTPTKITGPDDGHAASN